MCFWVLEVKTLMMVSPIISSRHWVQNTLTPLKMTNFREEKWLDHSWKQLKNQGCDHLKKILCSIEMVFRWIDQDHGVHERKRTNSFSSILLRLKSFHIRRKQKRENFLVLWKKASTPYTIHPKKGFHSFVSFYVLSF